MNDYRHASMDRCFAGFLLLLCMSAGGRDEAWGGRPESARTGPDQPSEGPGGKRYPHAAVRITGYGTDLTDKYWLYEPADPSPAQAFVVIFFHGTTKVKSIHKVPMGSRKWVEHIARKGYVVVFPLYQYDKGNAAHTLAPIPQLKNAVQVVRGAFAELMDLDKHHVRPVCGRENVIRYGTVGHSRGGAMALNFGRYHEGLAAPEAIVASAPGGFNASRLGEPIPATTKIVIIGGEHDAVNGPLSPRDSHQLQWTAIAHIPQENRTKLLLRTDPRGGPAYRAGHDYPKTAGDACNALDYFGLWKVSVGLLDCVFRQTHCSYALGDGDDLTFMGYWIDGGEVRRMQVQP